LAAIGYLKEKDEASTGEIVERSSIRNPRVSSSPLGGGDSTSPATYSSKDIRNRPDSRPCTIIGAFQSGQHLADFSPSRWIGFQGGRQRQLLRDVSVGMRAGAAGLGIDTA
jgi:hypothetical protein